MKNLKRLNLSSYSVTNDGNVYSNKSNRFLKNYVSTDGYYKLTLTNDEGQIEYWRVHRLVAHAYCEGYSEGLHVNHLDGNKLNNHHTNLEWCTAQENTLHSLSNGLQSTTGGKELPEQEIVHKVCAMLEQGIRTPDISETLCVDSKFITNIRNKTHYSYISDEYNIDWVKKAHKLSLEKVREICQDLSEGLNLCEVSKKRSVGTSTVHRIRKRQTYTDISRNFVW